MFQMMGVFAEFERAMIREPVKAGLERARAQGKTLGRPTISAATDAAIRKALKKGDLGVRKMRLHSESGRAPFSGSKQRWPCSLSHSVQGAPYVGSGAD
jgi:DNA invertase Pin-like site-specific DNA recombinase